MVRRMSSVAPANGPPTLPSLARNSSMIFWFQFFHCSLMALATAGSPGRFPGGSVADHRERVDLDQELRARQRHDLHGRAGGWAEGVDDRVARLAQTGQV